MTLDWTPCAQHSTGWQDATVPDDRVSRFFKSIGITLTPKQYDFIICPADDVGFGGSRGGAKSIGVVLDWIWHDHEFGGDANGAVFRRERVQLAEFIAEAEKLFTRVNATITEPKAPHWKWHHQGQYFESPNGSRLKFVYLDKDSDADKHQSGSFTRIYIEERGTFPRERPLNMILGTLRSGRGVPCQLKSTFNPGGVGHLHCKDRYKLHEKIPRGYEIFKTAEGDTRCFIPSKLRDNPYLGDSYVRTLRAACAGNEALLNAWLNGEWSLIEGAFFENWRGDHVVEAFDIPADWLRFRSIRWGSARPLSVGWWAVAGKDCDWGLDAGRFRPDAPFDDISQAGLERPSGRISRGSLVRYREWYAQKSAGSNEGLKLTAEQIADGILQRTEPDERISYTVASPEIFDSGGGPSIAERMGRRKVYCIPADNFVTKGLGPASGWDEVRARLVGLDGTPTIFCFQGCSDSVRTIPALQHDREKPEEIDDESEIAAADDWRFACMSRPWIPFIAPPKVPDHIGLYGDENGVTHSTLTFLQIIDRLERKRKSRED